LSEQLLTKLSSFFAACGFFEQKTGAAGKFPKVRYDEIDWNDVGLPIELIRSSLVNRHTNPRGSREEGGHLSVKKAFRPGPLE
jgi:hypothetical protein